MSTRIYLDQEVRKAVLGNVYFLSSLTNFKFKGIHLENENEELYLEIDPTLNGVPKPLELHVERVTLCEVFFSSSTRECGIYENDFAQAELRVVDHSPITYSVKIAGKNIEGVKNLLQLIRSGGIRPTVSYETPQGGLSRIEIEYRLEKTEEEKTKLIEELEKIQINENIIYQKLREEKEETNRLCERISAVEKYIEDRLESGVFALIKKSSVAKTLRDLLFLQ